MTDLDLLARQLRRETEQGTEARHRLTKNTRRQRRRQLRLSTVYGQKLLKHSTGVIAEHMTKSLKHAANAASCYGCATVYNTSSNADAEILAVIAIKVALDTLAITDKPTPSSLGPLRSVQHRD